MEKSPSKRISLLTVLPAFFLILFVLWHPFLFLDEIICDILYRQLDGVNPNIKIIAIDEETLGEFGKFETWSREKTAQTVNLLCSDPDYSPQMIGIDLLFTGSSETAADQALADACENARYAVVSSNIIYRGEIQEDDQGSVYYNKRNISGIELPYEALAAVTDHGFVNALIASDGYVRYTRVSEQNQGQIYPSFSWQLYSAYQKNQGKTPVLPPMDRHGQTAFFYSGGIGEFPHFSMSRVLSGEIPISEFKDAIVLIGAYAPGFQDAYATPVDRGGQMYGVEIHANVIQALMQEKTAIRLPVWIYCIFSGLAMTVLFAWAENRKLQTVIFRCGVVLTAHLVLGRILLHYGYLIPQFYFIAGILLSVVYFVFEKYSMERIRKKKLLKVFKTYVAPQVVDVLAKDDGLSRRLGGEKRQVAVMFVDIRGFTTMSENLEPETVVQILNEYLALTTECIFRHQGTLDKFIGDATMAIFNAPVDLPDYVFQTVSAALDMKQQLKPLSRKIHEKYGKELSFGIGINCGEAVIGNIGCQVRMDYTAIGDTVNTASRLESRAGRGEILISQQVYDWVCHRICAEYVGEMELKGKSHSVKTYRVIGYKGGSPDETGFSADS